MVGGHEGAVGSAGHVELLIKDLKMDMAWAMSGQPSCAINGKNLCAKHVIKMQIPMTSNDPKTQTYSQFILGHLIIQSWWTHHHHLLLGSHHHAHVHHVAEVHVLRARVHEPPVAHLDPAQLVLTDNQRLVFMLVDPESTVNGLVM